ncbi:phospholipase/carboxylesterase [Listeria riparia FSL S10-1204]|uniref:Phospholipase/carboxylesterase n=1 Tax=Listeria riparia FSL S10-1204 TaxID=1265816 RepID=W7DNR9_9LIST|nr:phospholipase/carboxylesterase [Listeria riparia FSL S10-1204]
MTAGVNDPLISAEGSQQLIDLLVERGAVVTDVWTQQGHQLTLPEVEAARDWYGTLL